VQALATGWADDPDTRLLIIDRAATDLNGTVRAAAVRALAAGWADHPDTHPLLAERAEADQHEQVRAAAAWALTHIPASTAE
jgi:HEAT repeat protein